MSTRGISGFKFKDKYYLAYNHCDSYPSGLGEELLKFVHHVEDYDKLKTHVEQLIPVKNSDKPTQEDIERYKSLGYLNPSVSNQTENEWYCLLRNVQYSEWLYEVYMGNLKHFLDDYNFVCDSLFCEYGYIIDLDKMTLNCYKGFQEEPYLENEFGQEKNGNYYPIKLYAQIPIQDIRDGKKEMTDKIYDCEKIEKEE